LGRYCFDSSALAKGYDPEMAADNEEIGISYQQASGEYRRMAICVNMPENF